ncbi:MAG: hypothetical protein P1U72_18615 [Paracoccaceae bacterium]|nr:hypothetical protein [Paracoccaceae bacterium]
MSKKDSYSGGSTVIRLGSNWFSKPQSGVDPESGETRVERIRRLTTEAERRLKKKEAEKLRLAIQKKKVPKVQRPQPDLDRKERQAKQRAEAKERISRVSVEHVRKKKIKKMGGPIDVDKGAIEE